uniref:Rho-GAP domain-containing protein n=1 Tax=Bursaphelenchus xylophilus TaxID=6326 RepID=A0A1I7RHI4_BURXY
MGTNYSDLKVRISFLCDDPLSIQQVLTPLLDQVVQTDDSGGCFCVDVSLSSEPLNARVGLQCGSYHHWLLSKWQLNAFNGHILVYSPNRMASWRHAEASVQLLLDAASFSIPSPSNILERQNMARSIMLIAVDEPSSYFKDKDSSHLLTEGAQLAEKIGCKFMAISSSMPRTAQFQFYNTFFSQIMHLPPFPDITYTVCSQNPSLFVSKRRPTYFNNSTVTGSALTLLSNHSSSGSSSLLSSNPSSAQNTTAQCSQIPSLNHEPLTSSTPPLSARSADSRNQPVAFNEDMTNRLRRPLSAIGSLMSASQSAENGSQSSHEEPGDVLTAEGLSRNLRFSPSKFRRLFQRNAGSESSASAEEKSNKKQLQRSSTVDGATKAEVVPASELNGFTSYIKVPDINSNNLSSLDRQPRKPHKSRSVESIGEIQMTPRIEQVAKDDENQKPIERGRQSRMKRFTHRCKELTTKARRRGHSMTPRINLISGSPTSSAPHSPSDLSYSSECKNGDDIPSFLRACVQHIERVGGLDTEGLYRTSGNQAEANEVEAYFRRTGQFKSDVELSSAVTALKNYVNAFAEPLIPTRLHEEIINIFSDRDDVYDSRPLETKSLDRLRRLFERELPRVNARTLMFLCAHLCRVAENRARNLMPTSNLALIWSASIFRPELTCVSKSASLLARYHVACYFCIKHHHILFSFPP